MGYVDGSASALSTSGRWYAMVIKQMNAMTLLQSQILIMALGTALDASLTSSDMWAAYRKVSLLLWERMIYQLTVSTPICVKIPTCCPTITARPVVCQPPDQVNSLQTWEFVARGALTHIGTTQQMKTITWTTNTTFCHK